MQTRKPDALDQTVAFLAKRDGIDKALKIIRYSTRLLLATSFKGESSELAQRLSNFESSIGTSRKAYRLGKFLGDVNALRRAPLRTPYGLLEAVACGGECVYYFLEQLQWLVKAGLLPGTYSARLGRVSALGELVGYGGSVTLGVLRISTLLEREVALLAEVQRRRKVGPAGEADKALLAEIRLLRARRVLRTLMLAQDLADSLLALADIRGPRAGRLGSPALLAAAGLLSGVLSAYKNWPGVSK